MEDADSLAPRERRDQTFRRAEKSDARHYATDARQSVTGTGRSPYHPPGSLSGRSAEGRIFVDATWLQPDADFGRDVRLGQGLRQKCPRSRVRTNKIIAIKKMLVCPVSI